MPGLPTSYLVKVARDAADGAARRHSRRLPLLGTRGGSLTGNFRDSVVRTATWWSRPRWRSNGRAASTSPGTLGDVQGPSRWAGRRPPPSWRPAPIGSRLPFYGLMFRDRGAAGPLPAALRHARHHRRRCPTPSRPGRGRPPHPRLPAGPLHRPSPSPTPACSRRPSGWRRRVTPAGADPPGSQLRSPAPPAGTGRPARDPEARGPRFPVDWKGTPPTASRPGRWRRPPWRGGWRVRRRGCPRRSG